MKRNRLRVGIKVILMLLVIATLGFSLYQIVCIQMDYKEAEEKVEDLRKVHEQTEDDESENRDCSGSELPVDAGLLKLHEQNEDCVAWISIEDTEIDYPVMLHPSEKDYYLHRDFDGEYSSSGCLYFAEDCNLEHSDNLLIYGHHMKNGSMFGNLEKYKDASFWEEHSVIHMETLTGPRDYKIIAVFTSPVYTGHDYEYYSFINALDKSEYDDYVAEAKSRSLYDTGLTADYGEQLLTLSTCEYSQKNGRMVVVAKQITRGGVVE